MCSLMRGAAIRPLHWPGAPTEEHRTSGSLQRWMIYWHNMGEIRLAPSSRGD
jgi:hypothetical protein